MRLPYILTLSILHTALGRPVEGSVSVLGSSLEWRDLPAGKHAVSRHDMKRLGAMADQINLAYCPSRPDQREADVLVTSADVFEELEDDMRWYISHTSKTQTLTLAMSSIDSIDDLLELLASDPIEGKTLVSLPPQLFNVSTLQRGPRIHHSYLPAIESHGVAAFEALQQLIANPPAGQNGIWTNISSWFSGMLGRPSSDSIKRVEIMGHGVGGAVGLLVSLALRQSSTVEISTTTFSSPRVGDQLFASWVDSLISPKFQLHRVTSYADTITHLPERHLNLAHPSTGEIWVGADPRNAYACVSENAWESPLCSASIALGRTSLVDHAGPFGGVWIGRQNCYGEDFDLTAL